MVYLSTQDCDGPFGTLVSFYALPSQQNIKQCCSSWYQKIITTIKKALCVVFFIHFMRQQQRKRIWLLPTLNPLPNCFARLTLVFKVRRRGRDFELILQQWVIPGYWYHRCHAWMCKMRCGVNRLIFIVICCHRSRFVVYVGAYRGVNRL